MIKRIPKKKIEEILKKRDLEDFESIKFVERILKKQRGYVFKMPRPGTPVISLFSGGLDATVVSAMLLEEFGLVVYPLFLDNGHGYSKYEEKSADFFAEYFLEKYGKKFKPLKKLDSKFPISPISDVDYNRFPVKQNFFYSTLQCIYAVQHAYRLEKLENKKIRCIITSYMRADGKFRIDQTFSAIRKTMLNVCMLTKDFSWQISSLPIEKELGYFHDKSSFIKWAYSKNIPIEKTRSSCKQMAYFHCGRCEICMKRKEEFQKAGVIDKTTYYDLKGRFLGRLIMKARNLLVD